MKRSIEDVVMRGLGGGLLAGLVVAIWFLTVDTIQGQPFHTPAVLAHFFVQRDTLTVSVGLVAFYTMLHFGVFALLGVTFAWGLALFETAPSLLLGAAFGVIVLDLVFYGALVISGSAIFGVLPGMHVLGANLVGGAVLMAFLHRTGHEPGAFGLGVLRGHAYITEGITTGLFGAVAVALWFLAVDVAVGQPLRTPAALGAALFLGAQAPTDYAVSAALVCGYTALHLAVFAGFGVLLVALARGLERAPQFVLMVVLAGIVLEAFVLPAMAIRAEWVLGTLEWWTVAVGNVLAVGVMGWRVWRTHPQLRHVLSEPVHQRS